MTRFCLDSWAVLRWLEGTEPAASRVDAILTAAEGDERQPAPVMSWINAGEVYYVVHRASGGSAADVVLRDLRSRCALDDASSRRVLDAARLKARYRFSFADGFAIAAAQAHNATLVTGNPEILDAGGHWRTEDLR